ncbi:PREDICTED: zinc finger protein 622 isoform X2 [Myotis brandtii]|uniref:zinc finger protein 622 isoform X2 n=1 Tax=Myotis brandtii TaxID=109478 RepID=UPI0007040EEC|nr:PREDICTED: zinc finger protein 622 isoform X2 [Myotis brandtii]
MATYTCITCRVAFGDPELQRAHYKTDWHRYNLKRKVADMAPVTAEGFQERVRAQRAVAEEESKGTATYCTVCSKKFACANAYENHLRSRRHVELERKAVSRRVEMMNEKNLEKGLGVDRVDKDAMNAAIQQVIKAQPSPKRAPPAPGKESGGPGAVAEGGRAADDRDPAEKPPRLQWFERQAKKLAKQQGEEESEEGDLDGDDWEDIDSDEEMECEDVESMDELEEQDAEEEEAGAGAPLGAISIKDCLFCSHHSSSLMKNVAHMTKIHSFFIPDIEYLSDLKGLIQYLGEKVGVGKICLWCNEKGKSFYSTEAVQAHMNDKSHCKLFTDGDAALEFADFYDFRSSYPDHKDREDPDETEELPSEKTLDYDDETMELILPSEHCLLWHSIFQLDTLWSLLWKALAL